MRLLEPRSVLQDVVDRLVTWGVVLSVGLSLLIGAFWALLTFWQFFLGLAVGVGVGWLARTRYGW